MRVVLTGAFGNVGAHTLPQLIGRGHRVRCFDLLTAASKRSARRLDRQLPEMAEFWWADITDAEAVMRAVTGVDTVVHLAAVIPPEADEQPQRAYAVNVEGTRNVIAACRAQTHPPRLLFTSTLDVHGFTLDRPPPRRVDDPLMATDPYTTHKIECESLIQRSGLDWAIFRLADVPVLGPRAPHPIMFEIGLRNRIEAIHAADAGLAIVNALETPRVWGRVLFVGGGPSCQVTYEEYLTRMLAAIGIKPLPRRAFSQAPYVTDWLDTAESAALLDYQRHSLDDIAAAVAASMGWRRSLAALFAPLARRSMLRMSPYY